MGRRVDGRCCGEAVFDAEGAKRLTVEAQYRPDTGSRPNGGAPSCKNYDRRTQASRRDRRKLCECRASS